MTDVELAVLTLVAERPRHGYEIEQVIEERGMRNWTEIGFSSIYYVLKKLEREGLIDSQMTTAERGPARKVYHLTPTGRLAQHAALIQALSEPAPTHSRLLLGISSLPSLSPKEIIEALQSYQGSLAVRLEELRTKQKNQQALPYFVDALFEYSKTMIQAESAWIEQFIVLVQEETSA